MNIKETLNQIKSLLNSKVNLETQKLIDGKTILEAESFTEGQSVFIKTETDNVALPIGNYEMELGNILIVETEGTIASFNKGEETKIDNARTALEKAFGTTLSTEEETPVEETVETQPEEVVEETVEVQQETETEEVVEEEVQDFVPRSEFDEAINTIAKQFVSFKESYELNKQALTDKETEIETLKVDLAKQPATTKITHSPKADEQTKTNLNKGQNLKGIDFIYNKINNI